MNIQYSEVKADQLASSIKPDELLIILSYANDSIELQTQGSEWKWNSNCNKDYRYLTLQMGTHQSGFTCILGKLNDDGNSSLERRWVWNQLVKYLKSFNNPKKLVFWFSGNCLAEKQAVVEDVMTSYMTALYDQLKIDSIRIISDQLKPIDSADPHRDVRIQHQIGYRAWLNENPDELTSIEIGVRLKKFAGEHKVRFTEMGLEELKKNNMNLLLAVGQASTRSPSRLYILDYNPNKIEDEKPLLLIGKGVTFDTGGINLKPHESFVNCMKNDMGGAALMSMVFMSLVASGFNKRVVLAIPCCENLIAEKSMKPGVILKSYGGKSVIIEHTDAEGRLILADALGYCHDHFTPSKTIIAATLTTAALRQFTNFFTPVHFADQMMQKLLSQRSEEWGEGYTFWGKFLPFLEGNESNAADLTNMGRMPANATGCGGSNVAAHFLDQFAKYPIIHFDIFASAWNWSNSYPGAHYGATGAPFNSLFMFLREDGVHWLEKSN